MMTKSNPSSLTAIGPEEPFVPTLCLIRGFGLSGAGRAWKVVDGSQMMTNSNPSSLTAMCLEETYVPTLCLMPVVLVREASRAYR